MPIHQAHQSRTRAVWGLLALVVLLVVGLKTGSPDRDAYKNLVFGEGGLVEWSQVLVLVLASRTAWLIGSDLNARLQERRPGRLFQCGAACLALVLDGGARLGPGDLQLADPPLLNEINAQNETTLHNIGFVSGTTGSGHLPGDPWGFGCCGSGAALDARLLTNTVLNRWRPCWTLTGRCLQLAAVSGGFCTGVLHCNAGPSPSCDPQSGSGVG